jgi:pyroglutamyl-peptidase
VSRTLITGFGPFLEVADNPSATIAGSLGQPFQVLEVSYEAVDTFIDEFNSFEYDNLLMLGVARGRTAVSVELVAKNLRMGGDVLGHSRDGLIEHGAPETLESTMWTRELTEFLKIDFGTEIKLSWDAGEYLCNYLYYKALRHLVLPRIGFLHVVDPDVLSIQSQEGIVRAVLSELRN